MLRSNCGVRRVDFHAADLVPSMADVKKSICRWSPIVDKPMHKMSPPQCRDVIGPNAFTDPKALARGTCCTRAYLQSCGSCKNDRPNHPASCRSSHPRSCCNSHDLHSCDCCRMGTASPQVSCCLAARQETCCCTSWKLHGPPNLTAWVWA